MVLDNLGLVSFAVSRTLDRAPHGAWDREDIFAYGVLGLIQAVDTWDADKGASFASFALIRIRGAILDFKRRMDILPRSSRRGAAQLEQARNQLANELGRWPTVEELAERQGVSVGDIRRMEADAGAALVYLDLARRGPPGEVRPWEPADLDDADNPEEVAEAKLFNRVVDRSIRLLPRRDRDLIEMRYRQSLTFKEIASRLHVTQSRVSQLNKRALAQLRDQISVELGLAS